MFPLQMCPSYKEGQTSYELYTYSGSHQKTFQPAEEPLYSKQTSRNNS